MAALPPNRPPLRLFISGVKLCRASRWHAARILILLQDILENNRLLSQGELDTPSK